MTMLDTAAVEAVYKFLKEIVYIILYYKFDLNMKNLANILRNASKDLKLYSPIIGTVQFKEVLRDNTIKVYSELDNSVYIFQEDGRWFAGILGECVLWPSQFERTWDDWQSELLVDGDYVYDTESEETFILIYDDDEFALIDCFGARHSIDVDYFSCLRFASPEEIEVFKTKRDESEVEFKKNDYIIEGRIWKEKRIYKILKVKGFTYTALDITDHDNQVNLDAKEIDKHFRLWNTKYDAKPRQILRENTEPGALVVFHLLESDPEYFHTYADIWADDLEPLGSNGWVGSYFVPATYEEQEYFYKKVREAGYDWDETKTGFVKQSSKYDNCAGKNNATICADLDCQSYVRPDDAFKDYHFEPFEKVLVRDEYNSAWQIELYSHYDEKEKEFHCLCANWFYCIPYNDRTKHLVGTTKNTIKKA